MTRGGALFLLLCALLIGGPVEAQRRMDVALVPETVNVLPGTTLTVAFVMRPGAGWHGYWRNPGDAGAEPRVRWRLPEGWSAEPLQYPAPDRLIVMGLMNYVFERDYTLLATIRVPADAEPGVASPIDARPRISGLHERGLRAGRGQCVGRGLAARRAPRTRPRGLPQALPRRCRGPAGSRRRNAASGSPSRCRPGSPLSEPYFFPATSDALSHAAPQTISRNGDMLIVETGAGPSAATLGAIEGVMELGPGIDLSLTARPGPVPAAGETLATVGGGASAPSAGADGASAASGGGGGEAPGGERLDPARLLGALAGGLILNVMPCVFRSQPEGAEPRARRRRP